MKTRKCSRSKSRKAAYATAVCASMAMAFTLTGPSLSNGNLNQAKAAGLGEGGRARINASEKLMILSQKMAASACSIDLGYNVESEREMLRNAHGNFRRTLDALELGDARLGISTPETYSKAKIALGKVRALWGPISTAVDGMQQDNPTDQDAKVIAQTNEQLLKETEVLASIILNEYANPFDLVLADALSINIAERQEVCSQKLKREACEIGSGQADEAIKADFVQTIDLFEISLNALREGFPVAGVRPPPNDEIRYQLDQAWTEWQDAQTVITAIMDKSNLTEDEMKHISQLAKTLDDRMHTVVVQYLLTAPGASDLLEIPLTAYAETALMEWTTNPEIVSALRQRNKNAAAPDADTLEQLQAQWVAETAQSHGPLVEKVSTHPASALLKTKKLQASDKITEIVLIDNHGLVLAESELTPDYVHIGAPRWETLQSKNIYISDVHLEEGGHVYQAEVALPVYDPDSGDRLGVMSFGINVQYMF